MRPYTHLLVALLPLLYGCADRGTERTEAVTDTTSQQTDNVATAALDTVTIHFSRGEVAEAVGRPVPLTGAPLGLALRELLKGPTAAERQSGLHSWFSDATADALQSVSIDKDGRAVVQLADLRDIIPGASSSAGSAMLLQQLDSTVLQFGTVQSVEYRMAGSCSTFWNWLQYGDCRIVTR